MSWKPKVIKLKGVAIGRAFPEINDDLRKVFQGKLQLQEILPFDEAYKTNKRGSHMDVFLGAKGTIIFRPFHFVDGLDNFCWFGTQGYSKGGVDAMEFFFHSSTQHCKFDLWHDEQFVVNASQKKSIRVKGNKNLIHNNSVYDTCNTYLHQITGYKIEDLDDSHFIHRCVIETKKLSN